MPETNIGFKLAALALPALALPALAMAEANPHGAAHPAPRAKPAPAHAPASPASPSSAHEEVHWGYAGMEAPVHWGHLSPEYQSCSSGRAQSPIDLSQANVTANVTVNTSYRRGPLTVLNNGHTVQANFPEGSTFTTSGHRYKLVQVHFHTPSENMVDGKSYPLEAHFVHRDDAGQLAVLGVFFEEGPVNIELAKLVVAAPNRVGGPRTIEGFTFDPNALLPEEHHVYRFMGSLTTPPCTEGVHWHVARQVMTASTGQIAALNALMGQNARPVQPLNDRLVITPE